MPSFISHSKTSSSSKPSNRSLDSSKSTSVPSKPTTLISSEPSKPSESTKPSTVTTPSKPTTKTSQLSNQSNVLEYSSSKPTTPSSVSSPSKPSTKTTYPSKSTTILTVPSKTTTPTTEEKASTLASHTYDSDERSEVRDAISRLCTKPSQNSLLRHMAAVGECYRRLYTQDVMCDVTIHIDRQTFNAHKALLMAHSEYFHSVLTQAGKHTQTEIHLGGLPPGAFKIVLQYMYTSDVVLTVDNVADVYTVSHQLMIPGLIDKCQQILGDLDTNPNKSLMVMHSSTSKDSDIFYRAQRVVICHFAEVVHSPSLAKQHVDIILPLLKADDLVVNSEMDVFEAGLLWLRKDMETRISFASKIFGSVRYWHLTPLQLLTALDIMERLEVVQSEESQHIIKAMWYSVCQMYKHQCRFNFNVSPQRQYLKHNEYPLLQDVYDGNYQYTSVMIDSSTDSSSSGQPYHLSASHLAEKEVDKEVALFSEAALEDPNKPEQCLLIVGGRSADPNFNPEDVGKAIYQFRPKTLQWTKVGELLEPRHLHAVAFLGDCLYVVVLLQFY